MPDIFDEVEQDLRADQARALLRRYGWVGIAGAVLIIAAVGGWEAWRAHLKAGREAEATLFLAAQRDAADPARRDQAIAGFARLAAQAGPGYRALARIDEAGLKDAAGDHAGAQALWDQVAADPGADQLLRDTATLAAVSHAPADADPAALRNKVGPLTAPTNPLRSLALEQSALLDIRAGNLDRARESLRAITSDTTAPDPVRGRATALLQRLDA